MNKALTSEPRHGDLLLHEFDGLLETQGRLLFAQDRYDAEEATTFGVRLLDFMRKHGAEIRPAIASLSVHKWQPIQTAPKSTADGSRVDGIYLLGFIPDDDLVDRTAMIDVIWWEPLLPNNKGGRGKWCASRYGEACEVTPTHWQMLPAPPAIEQMEAGDVD